MKRTTLPLLALLVCPATAAGQGLPELRVERLDGSVLEVPVAMERGYAAVPISVFEELGWSVARVGQAVAVSGPYGVGVSLRLGSPFFRWEGEVLQLADAPYRDGQRTLVPVQLLVDFFPRRLSELYAFDGPSFTLRAGDPGTVDTLPGATEATTVAAAEAPKVAAPDAPKVAALDAPTLDTVAEQAPTRPDFDPADLRGVSPYDGVRVVVIDAGHGGGDPGALGPDGIREKSVALGIAQALAKLLGQEPGLEVYMTRKGDTFVDIWDRGDQATDIKGERPGVFVSVHGNSFPSRRAARGFETYFLSEARNDHERRVAAIENAPLRVQGQDVDPDVEPDLGFILRELRALDSQHWSALLAEMVQDELADFHPGPNRGVKQGVLAVLTNALMPSVLVEVGYLSNDEEGRLLGTRAFQEKAAEALSEAILRFFKRYPPGSGAGAPGDG